MEGNWLEINGHKIAVGTIQITSNSPLSDKTFVFLYGQRISQRTDKTYPFTINLCQADLNALGLPQLLQKQNYNQRYDNVVLYSDGTYIGTYTMMITNLNGNLNGDNVTADVMLFKAVSEFVTAITNKKVSSLIMDGPRKIEHDHNYLTGPVMPGAYYQYPYLNNAGVPLDLQTDFTIPDSSVMVMRGAATCDYATQLTLNGDPNSDEYGPFICFPTAFVYDGDDSGDCWINYFDPQDGRNYYPAYLVNADLSGPGDTQNIYTEFIVNDLGNHIVPCYYYHQVIRHCFSEHGYQLIDETGFLDDEHFRRIALLNTFDILNTLMASVINHDGTKGRDVGYMQRTTYINPANHLPDDTIQDFLLDFMMKFNCYFDFEFGKAYLRKGKYNEIDRMIPDNHPQYQIQNTYETGLSMAYEYPSDKKYEGVTAITDMVRINTSTGTNEKIYSFGINKVYSIPSVAGYDSTSIVTVAPDNDYFIHLQDLNILLVIQNRTYKNYLYFDNVVNLVAGLDTRSDSPTLNIATENGNNATSYALKYAPVNTLSRMSSSDIPVDGVGTPYAFRRNTQAISTDEFAAALGVMNFNIQPNMDYTVGDILTIETQDPAGTIYITATIMEYNVFTGKLKVNATSWGPSGYVPPTSTSNHWDFSLNDLALYTPIVPVLNQKLSYKRTTSFLFRQAADYDSTRLVAGTTYLLSNRFYAEGDVYSFLSDDGGLPEYDYFLKQFIAPLWLHRTEQAIFESGFYWGVQNCYAPVDDNYGNDHYSLPVFNNNTGIPHNSDVARAEFTLSLLGMGSLVDVFYSGFIAQFHNNKKVTFGVYESLNETRRHRYDRAVIIRGIKVYISQIQYELPFRGKAIQYLGYPI